MSRPRILIAEPEDFSAAAVERLRRHATVDLRAVAPGELRRVLRDYDVFWFRLGWPIDARVLDEHSRCRIIATPVTGIDHIDEALCARLGVRIVSLRGERAFLRSVRATAEHTLALALAVMRHLPAASRDAARGRWVRDDFRGHELYERTAGVVGCGRLGAIVAEYLLALGMRVLTYDPRAGAQVPTGVDRLDDLDDLLRQSDLVTLHVNYDDTTRGLFGAGRLAACKPGAILVNTSRGGLLDEAALLAALRSGHLAAAALDVVTDERGFGPGNPLAQYARQHDNLLLTPHIGGNTYESFRRTEGFIAGRVLAALGVKEDPA